MLSHTKIQNVDSYFRCDVNKTDMGHMGLTQNKK